MNSCKAGKFYLFNPVEQQNDWLLNELQTHLNLIQKSTEKTEEKDLLNYRL